VLARLWDDDMPAVPRIERNVTVVDPEGSDRHELYLLCDDIEATAQELHGKGVELERPFHEERWGRVSSITLPGGGKLGIYQPMHPLAHRRAR